MRIDWRVIPHKDQRYDSAGDWYLTLAENDEQILEQVLNIRISHLSDPRWEFCLGLHELVEAMLCYFVYIRQNDVDAFDMPYEAAYQRRDAFFPCGCPRKEPSDPGSDIHAPYAFQHKIADAVERVVAAVLGVHWASYDSEVDRPPQ